jgi:thiamine biosynthesis lipoprotein
MERRAFQAMGTVVELLLDAPPSVESLLALASAQRELQRLEALLSRFRESSELSALNRDGRIEAGPELLEVTRLALAARTRTGGAFDPTVHDAVVAAGYDRSFDELDGRVALAAPPARCGGRISIDARTSVIELEPGFRLDLGGIAKGWAVDRICRRLAAHGPCLVDAGGDIAVAGEGWPVGVVTSEGTLTLELSNRALATSGSDRRRWQTTDGEAHHLVDPRTGEPADSDLVRVTVVADTAADAEVLAKMLYLAGAGRAENEARANAIPAVLLTTDGRTVLAGGLA